MSELNVIDLFSGVGGLSLGAFRAGFNVVAAVDTDTKAIGSHSKNFPNTIHLNDDISAIDSSYLLESAGLSGNKDFGLIGGPPCQGFSAIGKKQASDPRNNLFGHFFRVVSEIQPTFFLAENVPGILKPIYSSIVKTAFSQVTPSYSIVGPLSVTASDYGAPTTRKRIFFFGIRKDINQSIGESFFLPPESVHTPKVKEALEGLPIEIDPNWLDEESGWRQYEDMTETTFSRMVKGRIPHGVGHAPSIERYNSRRQVSGCMGTRHSKEVAKRYGLLRYNQRDQVSRSVRLDPDGFCPTLRAGTDIDRGKFQAVRPIHWREPRVITPREAARLQGFPDWFVFHRTKWHSFRQIGNSVSPIVAEHLLTKINNLLSA